MSSRTRRLSILLGFAVLLLAVFLWGPPLNREPSLHKRSGPILLDNSPLLRGSRQDMQRALQEAYLLAPDRRFLIAVAETHALFSGKQAAPARAEFKENQWQVYYGDRLVGKLPEFPDLADFLPILRTWAKSLQQQFPFGPRSAGLPAEERSKIEEQASRFVLEGLFSALESLGAVWSSGRGDPEILKLATRSLVLLNLQAADTLYVDDLLGGRALALLGVTQAMTGEPLGRDECLLAEVLDYSRAGSDACATLPKSDPAVLLADQNYEMLRAAALAPGSTRETNYFALLCGSRWDRREQWLSMVKSYVRESNPDLSVLKAGLSMGRFELAERLNGTILELVASRVGASNSPGPFLDTALKNAYFEGFASTAIHNLAIHYLDSLSSIEHAESLLQRMPQLPGTTKVDLARWYAHLIASKKGQRAIEPLAQDLEDPGKLGTLALSRTFTEMRANVPYVDPLPRSIRAMAKHMDSRPWNRLVLGTQVREILFDVPKFERMLKSVAVQSPAHYPAEALRFAQFTEDRKLMNGLLKDPRFRPAAFDIIMGNAGTEILPDSDLRTQFQERALEEPDNWGLRSGYVRYLWGKRYFERARQVIQDWLAQHGESWGFDYINAHNDLAATYYKEGHFLEGWEAIKPVVGSQQGRALTWAARLLDKMGREGEAATILHQALERYPDNAVTLAEIAEFHWNHGRFREAAEILKPTPYTGLVTVWKDTIGPPFLKVFDSKPTQETLAAFEALKNAGIPHVLLREMADLARKDGRYDLAFQMETALQIPGLDGFLILINAYTDLKKWKNRKEAWEWLLPRIPPSSRYMAVMVAFDQQEPELIWDLMEPSEDPTGEHLWMLRAAASLQLGKADPHRKALEKHFSDKAARSLPAPSVRFFIGRYLVGLVNEDELLAEAKDISSRCEAVYCIGLKAQTEGRLEDASDWWRIPAEMVGTCGESWRLASYALSRFQEAGVSLKKK